MTPTDAGGFASADEPLDDLDLALLDDVRDLYQAANRANVSFYPLDPRGLTMNNGRTTSGQMMNGLVSDRDGARRVYRAV